MKHQFYPFRFGNYVQIHVGFSQFNRYNHYSSAIDAAMLHPGEKNGKQKMSNIV
jgi:hypothetical protein